MASGSNLGVIQGAFAGGRLQTPPVAPPSPGLQPHSVARLRHHVPAMPNSRHSVAGHFVVGSVPAQPGSPAAGPQVQTIQRSANGDAFRLPGNLSHFGKGVGQPLPEPVLQQMESFFGTSFSDVRVHVGSEASSIGALAFTHGSNLYFAPGQFNPQSQMGKQLLGHELTHVVQQRAGRVRNPFGSGIAVVQDRGLEAEADRMGMQAAVHRVPPVQAKLAESPKARAAGSLGNPSPRPSLGLIGGGVDSSGSRQSGTVQPLTFARFSSWGFLSNWGSYNQVENRLRAQLAQVETFYRRLPSNVKRRVQVSRLKKQLDKISGSTLAANQYTSTQQKLTRIEASLEQERKRQYLMDRGYPENPIMNELYSGGIDETAWRGIVATIPKKHRKTLRQGNMRRGLVRAIFHSFCQQGFRYQIMAGGASGLLSKNRGDVPEGNCRAYARAFADVLNAYGIKAEARAVRRENQGRFIVKVDNFLDPKVRGHIYYKNVLQPGYYMFTSHAATWVPSEQLFFDPMSKASYSLSTFNSLVECDIDSARDGVVFTPKKAPKTLQPTFKWRLVLKKKELQGGFRKLELRPVKKRKY